jgi:transcriptional regulator with XRE-family HTH domain
MEPRFHLFGEKLRHLRTQHQLSQAEIARRLAVSRSFVNNLEAGRANPSLAVVVGAAAMFHMAFDYLLRDAIPVEAAEEHRMEGMSIPSMPPAHFGAKLHHLRIRNHVTQVELVQQLGVKSQAHVSLLESGDSLPSPGMVARMADLFGVTTDYLLRDDIPITEL